MAYDPELISIGGSVATNNPDFILPPIKKNVEKYLRVSEIKITKLGDDIGILGASAFVFQSKSSNFSRS